MISSIHTLGPKNTNCEKAAKSWLAKNNLTAEIFLYDTLEDAAKNLDHFENAALLSCIVYPKLHELVFENLEKFQLVDCFIEPTYNMVLAKKVESVPTRKIYTHPAPVPLLRSTLFNIENIQLVNSNAEAANLCSSDDEACITTKKASDENNLVVVHDFGPIPMGFAIHSNVKI